MLYKKGWLYIGFGKQWLLILLFIAVVYGVTETVYYLTSLTVENPDVNLLQRSIESPTKLWLNGYLGLFFGFKYLGVINWLVVPLFAIFLYKRKFKLKREELALISFFGLAFLLISSQGFFNFRYAFTLMTFCIFLVFYLLAKVSYSKAFFTITSLILILFIYSDLREKLNTPRVKEKIDELFASTSGYLVYVKKFNEMEMAEILRKLQFKYSNAEWNWGWDEKKVEVIPDPSVLDYINTEGIGQVVLVHNLPAFYYETNRSGLYYWAGDDHFFAENGRQFLFKDRDFSEVKELLKSRNCTHIYNHETYFGYGDLFDQFVKEECELVYQDSRDYQLYKINYD